MNGPAERFERLLHDREDIKQAALEVRSVQQQKGRWEFDDVDITSGVFGELVDLGIIVSDGDKYRIANPEEFDRVLARECPDLVEPPARESSGLVNKLISPLRHSVREIELRVLIWVAAVSIIFLSAFYIRYTHSDIIGLSEKSVYHAYVGESIFQDLKINLPSGDPYPRGIVQSLLVGLSITLLGNEPEFVRLPSILIGSCVPALAAWIVYQDGYPVGGILAAALTATAPVLVSMSITARMYISAVFFHLVVMSVLIYTLRAQNSSIQAAAFGMIISGIILSVTLHRFTLLTSGTVVVLTGLVAIVRPSFRETIWKSLAYRGRIILVSASMAVILLYIAPIRPLSPLSTFSSSNGVELYYTLSFFKQYSILSSFSVVYILHSIYTILNKQKENISGAIVLLFYLTPSLAMDLFLSVQHPKFYVLFFPTAFILSGLGFGVITNKIRIFVTNIWIWDRNLSGRVGLRSVCTIMMAGLLVGTLTTAVPPETVQEYQNNPDSFDILPTTALTEAQEHVAANASSDDIVISYYPESTYYYTADVDYYLRPDADGLTDEPITGAELIQNRSDIKNVLSKNKTVWIVYSGRLAASDEFKKNIDGEINQYRTYRYRPQYSDRQYRGGTGLSYVDVVKVEERK